MSGLTITAYGLVTSIRYYKVKYVLESLKIRRRRWRMTVVCEALLESEWEEFVCFQMHKVEPVRDKFARRMFNDTVMIFVNNAFLGGCREFYNWCDRVLHFEVLPFPEKFLVDAVAEMKRLLQGSRNTFVYLDISICEEKVGRLVFELYSVVAPKTCDNFRALCTGELGHPLCYKDTEIHRIVPKGWIQGGDILTGNGDEGVSVYGTTFEDETFAVRHSRRGVLGMANNGRHSNNSQFYITLAPSPWMDYRHVAFGQLATGCGVLRTLERLETKNERPVNYTSVSGCGICKLEEFELTDLTREDTALYLPSPGLHLAVPLVFAVPGIKPHNCPDKRLSNMYRAGSVAATICQESDDSEVSNETSDQDPPHEEEDRSTPRNPGKIANFKLPRN